MLLDDLKDCQSARDVAWSNFVKRKDVQQLYKNLGYRDFPDGGFYEIWCAGWKAGEENDNTTR